jgi:hypothetical protein
MPFSKSLFIIIGINGPKRDSGPKHGPFLLCCLSINPLEPFLITLMAQCFFFFIVCDMEGYKMDLVLFDIIGTIKTFVAHVKTS